ncbi:M20/M25/M40 family metallo-hydrolase [Pontibacter qinzhouensis]|uniref:M20/M25/M40 family metallo-hydrolase n=1 Tax=Pontibacter qinzhouensis TaxID=2603253 RepID=A0A5C8J2R9_9BACT|nr:M20/M25/M40 family metallo-hydrolase [Pontibacter qinzhouensis]TXK28424.1 M20/M25/M40 family metallo-hydrolase [Pontibacter qinzhouensis]
MTLKNFLPVFLFFGIGLSVQAQKLSVISQKETTRLISTLSADDMQGRATFTPGIEKAADFIQQEFRKTGLKPLADNSNPKDFRQTFKLYRLTPGIPQLEADGEHFQAEALFFNTSYQQLNWTNNNARIIVSIGEEQDFREAFSKLNKLEEDALVLVHPVHQKLFEAYRHHFQGVGARQETNAGSSKVFVLTDKAAFASYSFSVTNQVEQLPLFNVAGMIEGKRKDEIVVFSGHYDHIGILAPVAGDSIANGADDDASGTTAMMMLARYFAKQPKPERTLVFVAFTAEEIGGFGSRHFSEQLNPDQIVAMFNIEMVGKPSKFGPNTAYLTGFDKSDLGSLLQKRLTGTPYALHPDPYPEQNLFYRSDNATLARLGVPAHTVSSVQIDQDKTYHTVHDEVELLHMEHLTNMIRAIALAAQGVVNGQDTPSRIDKTLVR